MIKMNVVLFIIIIVTAGLVFPLWPCSTLPSLTVFQKKPIIEESEVHEIVAIIETVSFLLFKLFFLF